MVVVCGGIYVIWCVIVFVGILDVGKFLRVVFSGVLLMLRF